MHVGTAGTDPAGNDAAGTEDILEVIGRVYSLVKSNIIYKFSSSTLMRMCTHTQLTLITWQTACSIPPVDGSVASNSATPSFNKSFPMNIKVDDEDDGEGLRAMTTR